MARGRRLQTCGIQRQIAFDQADGAKRRQGLAIDQNIEPADVAGGQQQPRQIRDFDGLAGPQHRREVRFARLIVDLHPTVHPRRQLDAGTGIGDHDLADGLGRGRRGHRI